jgi:putative transcriptional regulator
MTPQDNAYTGFMLDHAAGRLPPAESLVADLHRALSPAGRSYAGMLDRTGGALLESVETGSIAVGPMDPGKQEAPAAMIPSSRLARYLEGDQLALRWRRDLVGVPTSRTAIPMARLLRLDPGEHAPGHCHGRRDVTVVLQGAFADETGVYEKGDLAFAMPGLRHQPRAVGVEPCVCMVATERGRPIRGLLGLFGIGAGKLEERA